MEWQGLLNLGRLGDDSYTEEPNRPIYVQDADRIVFSQPFRRLANKTQVHPLYDHDHLHHRLIHSVETSSVGRSIGMGVGHWLEANNKISNGEKHVVAGLVHAACLAHDIGNPPFGHSGEASIGEWFAEKFTNKRGLFEAIEEKDRREFTDFEGNAQGFRILAKLEMYRNEGGMRLSHGLLGAFSKYPVTAQTKGLIDEVYCGAKKFGIFRSEYGIFKEVAARTGLRSETAKDGSIWWRRHPLVFLVEAADDISYNILDLEDGFTAGDIPFEKVVALLSPVCGSPNQEKGDKTEIEWISYMRARSIGAAVQACVDAFSENYDVIMSGDFNKSLIEVSKKSSEFDEIKSFSRENLFTARRKTELEVMGRNTIMSVLDGLMPIFEALRKSGWDKTKLEGYDAKLVRALNLDIRDVNDPYSALHSLTDFVSGMTDRYTIKVAKLVNGV